MKLRMFAPIALAAATLAVSGSAQAAMIAGWDFSQFVSAGVLSADGATAAETLPANYSDLDTAGQPVYVGPAPPDTEYGRLYYDGQFGSSDQDIDFSGSEPFLPRPGNLLSNLDQPVGPPQFGDNSVIALQNEGQAIANPLAMFTQSPGFSVVFGVESADFGVPGIADWQLDLAGFVDEGTSNVLVQFSTDGSSYSNVTTFTFTPLDTQYTAILSPAASANGYVRLVFQGPFPASGGATIDNVGISGTIVPEPGTALLLASGLLGLVASGRRRA